MALCGKPNEPSIQHQVYIFMRCVDSLLASYIWVKVAESK